MARSTRPELRGRVCQVVDVVGRTPSSRYSRWSVPIPQLPLFDPGESVLADDDRGLITYTTGFVAVDVARRWFAELRAGVAWKAERRQMYDREVDVPRLTAHYHLTAEDLKASGAPEAIRQAARHV